jgi:DNA-binding NarL/FixJ family response regulator
MIRVLLYTDEPALAQGLCSMLAGGGFEIVGSCSRMGAVLDTLKHEEPDLLILNLTSEVTFAALGAIKQSTAACKLVLWVHDISPALAYQAMGLGVHGILRATSGSDVIVESLRRIHQGELWFDKTVTDRLLSAKRILLTKREGELVTLISRGLKNKEIASALQISEGTVKVYLSKLFEKVGVKDRLELALYGLKNLWSHHALGEPAAGEANSKPELPGPGLRCILVDGPPAARPQPPRNAGLRP